MNLLYNELSEYRYANIQANSLFSLIFVSFRHNAFQIQIHNITKTCATRPIIPDNSNSLLQLHDSLSNLIVT